jgi:hypothetical protein
MTRYLISFGAHAMDHIPDEDMLAVAKAAHAAVQEAVNAGVFVCAGGLEDQRASIVATDGTVTDGPYPEAIGGLTVRKRSGSSGPTPNSTRCSARQIGDGDVNLPV